MQNGLDNIFANTGGLRTAYTGCWNGIQWDQSRARIGHAAENLAIIRRLSLNLLRHAKGSKLGVKNKRLQACCDDAFRESILQLSPIDTEKKGEVLGSFL